MNQTLYVGNLQFSTTVDDLLQLFEGFGIVNGVFVVTDDKTGSSLGFAFVEMEDGSDSAIASLDGREFQGRSLVVSESSHPFPEILRRYTIDYEIE